MKLQMGRAAGARPAAAGTQSVVAPASTRRPRASVRRAAGKQPEGLSYKAAGAWVAP